jgi:hypothetical protein
MERQLVKDKVLAVVADILLMAHLEHWHLRLGKVL